jgi:colicin import membrane protein
MESSRRTLFSFSLALLVHGLLLGVLVLGFGWTPHSKPINTNPVSIVQATVVDKDKILAEMGQQQRAMREPQPLVTSERQKAEQQAVKAQRQQQERAEQAQREAKEQRELEQKRQQERARLKQLETERKAKEEARRRAEIERKQKQAEEEKKQQAEAKRRRLEEERRQAEVAKRKAEEERKKAEEAARRKAEDARRQQELQASIDAEQSAAQAKAAIERFIPQLQMRVQRYWIRPPSARDNMVTVLQVELLPSGDVRDVRIVESSGDRTFDRSAQAAVYRAAPLPVPTDSAAAAKLRSFNFKFCPGSSC